MTEVTHKIYNSLLFKNTFFSRKLDNYFNLLGFFTETPQGFSALRPPKNWIGIYSTFIFTHIVRILSSVHGNFSDFQWKLSFFLLMIEWTYEPQISLNFLQKQITNENNFIITIGAIFRLNFVFVLRL